MRRAYVQCILKQDIGWFDEHPAGQLPTAVTANMAKVQDGLGRKIGDIVLNGLNGGCFAGCVLSRTNVVPHSMCLVVRAYVCV